MRFVLWIVAIILGGALIKQFDFQTFSFEKPALAAVYLIVFAVSVGILVRGGKKS